MKKELLTAVTIALALLMWYSHADIFMRLETYNGKEGWQWMLLNTVLAIGFSGLTAICVRFLKDYKYAAGFAAFDATAIFFHFQSNIPAHIFNWIGSAYLALLMFFLVSMIWKLADMMRCDTEPTKIQTDGTDNTAIETETRTRTTKTRAKATETRTEHRAETEAETKTETDPRGNGTNLQLAPPKENGNEQISITKIETRIEFPQSVNSKSWNKMKRESQLRFLSTLDDAETKEILEENFLKAE